MDAKLTILSVDGIGAFDHVSRNSMLRGLMETDNANSALPFVRQFYGQLSAYFWDDELGNTQVIPQGDGGEQGDPLMPLLFCLSLHKALVAANARLLEGESLFAFLDDVYAYYCAPERVLAVHRILQQEIQTHCGISIHHGKTQIWNRGGEHPVGCEALTKAAQTVDPNAVVWRGDTQLAPQQQGIVVLGSTIGHEAFITAQLSIKRQEHQVLLDRIPHVTDVQTAWLLLLFCGATRANYWIRTVSPRFSGGFAQEHDEAVMRCLGRILHVDPSALHPSVNQAATLPFSLGGLGIRSAFFFV